MIQAPTSQYPQVKAQQIPASAPVQLAPAVQQTPVAAAPSTCYNYPTSSYYQYPQAQPQYNAVNINIINPQAFPGMPAQQAQPAPVMPVQYVQAPVQQAPTTEVTQIAEAPQPPAPVITEAPKAETPAPEPTPVPVPVPVEAPKAETPAPVEAPKVEAPQAQTPAVDVASFNARLRAENLEDQGKAIEEIAELTQTKPDAATQLLDTQIVEGLLAVIAKDTKSLPGPSPKQLELRQKLISGQTLTDAEKTEAETITPMETAERNKQYALYTVAFLQNLLYSEVEKRNGVKLDIKDLPAMEQVVQTAKSDPNPLLRVSALAALAHIAKPEYKPVLSKVFELAKSDSDPVVQEAAKKALEQLATIPDAPAAQPAAPAEAPKAEAPKAEEKKEPKKA